eukprot:7152054-Alexandrium_andersonii.AAC.1
MCIRDRPNLVPLWSLPRAVEHSDTCSPFPSMPSVIPRATTQYYKRCPKDASMSTLRCPVLGRRVQRHVAR